VRLGQGNRLCALLPTALVKPLLSYASTCLTLPGRPYYAALHWHTLCTHHCLPGAKTKAWDFTETDKTAAGKRMEEEGGLGKHDISEHWFFLP